MVNGIRFVNEVFLFGSNRSAVGVNDSLTISCDAYGAHIVSNYHESHKGVQVSVPWANIKSVEHTGPLVEAPAAKAALK